MVISSLVQIDTAGIGLRMPHVNEVLRMDGEIPWLELLLDNWLCPGGISRELLLAVVDRYPVALHGVGLSIGSTVPFDLEYLRQVKQLIGLTEALAYSEHLSFSQTSEQFIPDLLPLPYTEASLKHIAERVDFVQNFLGTQILLENISSYIAFSTDTYSETEFISELVKVTGCGLLLDINNLYVNQVNLGRNAEQALSQLPLHAVQQIHLAGFEQKEGYVIDAHNHPVDDEVWNLYRQVIARTGSIATLIEWDNDLPPLAVLLQEQQRAQQILDKGMEQVA